MSVRLLFTLFCAAIVLSDVNDAQTPELQAMASDTQGR